MLPNANAIADEYSLFLQFEDVHLFSDMIVLT